MAKEPSDSAPKTPRARRMIVALVVIFLGALLFLSYRHTPAPHESPRLTASISTSSLGPREAPAKPLGSSAKAPARTPEQTVANRLGVFARKRLDAAKRMARRAGLEVPEEVRQFFAAVEASDWPTAKAVYLALVEQRRPEVDPRPAALDAVWMAIHETYGVAEIAAEWPASALMQYAESVLNSVPPGTVYLGGTDAGRFAPLLFNDVGGVDDKVILTQNALADLSYLDYVNLLHGKRLEALTSQDSEANFSAYMNDARQRAEHDRDHPDEPPQLKPGEVVKISPDGRMQVSGQVAVMAINEGLLRSLMAKNPDLRFAIEEPYPLKSLNSEAVPNGPLLELRANNNDPATVAQRTAESLEIWRETAQRFQSDPNQPLDSEPRKAWSDLAAAQANYYADRQMSAQAEETWHRALEIAPGNVSALFGLTEYLVQSQRQEEALRLVQDFLKQNPNTEANVGDLLKRVGKKSPP